MATRLSECLQPKFTVDQRAVRERYAKIARYSKRRMANEERASGIVAEETELDQAIEDIIGMTEAAEEEHAHRAAARRAAEKITAEDVRERSMDRLAETQKRQKSEEEKVQWRNHGVFEGEGRERDCHTKRGIRAKKRELEIRTKELEQKRERDKQTGIMMNQQQQVMQQNAAIIAILSKLADK